MRKLLAKGNTLFLVSLIEYGAPLLRMLALSHLLTLRELGFASALTATYTAFEQITDFSIYRFVLSAPRERYDEALASAHALSIMRGAAVGAIAALCAPLAARAFSLSAEWPEFALLGAVALLRSFEHLGPRVAERDYSYGAQFKTSVVANGAALAVLLIGLLTGAGHRAVLASLLTQAAAQALASRCFAADPYRINWRSKMVRDGFNFGYPLMINGFGLAASFQGDRFVVGALLGLPELGIYAIVTLAALLPLNMLGRIVGAVLLAALCNAPNADAYRARVKLSTRGVALLAALYGVGVLLFLNIVTPWVFGAKFTLSEASVAILSVGVFLRLVRGEPFTSMLLHSGRTRRLTSSNLASSSALGFEFILLSIFRNFESLMTGRLLGEIVALFVSLRVTREEFRDARRDFLVSIFGAMGLLAGAIVLSHVFRLEASLPLSVAVFSSAVSICAIWALYFAPPLVRVAFPDARHWAARPLTLPRFRRSPISLKQD